MELYPARLRTGRGGDGRWESGCREGSEWEAVGKDEEKRVRMGRS